jgi:hexokinase
MQPFIAAMLKVRQAFFAAIVRSLRRTKSLLRTILTFWISPLVIKGEDVAGAPITKRRREEFLEEVDRVLRLEVDRERLLDISHGIKLQLKKSLQDHPLNMLPSYNHQLPTGDECGTYLALDVGGSTFRVALIELSGRKGDVPETKIMTSRSVKIDHAVRQLKGLAFFDWMAEKIEDALAGQSEGHDLKGAPLSAGLAWSFPIEYDFTSRNIL